MTPQQLQAASGCSEANAQLYAPALAEACAAYEINTPARLAAFVAQVGHESGSLRYATEIWGPTPAQSRYEGRADLGNTQPGDGIRFRGRGLIQTTGRYNYRAVRDRLRARYPEAPDFEKEPSRLAEPKWAAWSAADYWAWRGCNELADKGAFEAITRRINGGLNGYADRLARWERAKGALASAPTQEKPAMPLPAFVAAALPMIVESIPSLAKLFGSGSEVAERNIKAAETVVRIVQEATQTPNAQAAAEALRADPSAAMAAEAAIEARWFELAEAGGGGISGARAADAAAQAGGVPLWRSPSFVIGALLLPLVYMIVASVTFNLGGGWPSDVRASLATAVVSLILGALAGYYFGASTSANKATKP